MKSIYKKIFQILGVFTAVAIGATVITFQAINNRNLKERTTEQSRIITNQTATIDSLLKRKMKFCEIQLHVSDKSKNTIYGRYNKGSITIPAQKTYNLEIDSTNFNFN